MHAALSLISGQWLLENVGTLTAATTGPDDGVDVVSLTIANGCTFEAWGTSVRRLAPRVSSRSLQHLPRTLAPTLYPT